MTFNTTGLMSSNRSNWRTPINFYAALDDMFHFTFDPCPSDAVFDGLTIAWGQRTYANPPYGAAIKHWVRKGYEESLAGRLVVLLLPSRTDTRWWHDYVVKADYIWFVRGRLKFDDQRGSAPFPSAVVIFDGHRHSTPLIGAIDINGQRIM